MAFGKPLKLTIKPRRKLDLDELMLLKLNLSGSTVRKKLGAGSRVAEITMKWRVAVREISGS